MPLWLGGFHLQKWAEHVCDFQESVLSFCHVGLGDRTQAVGLSASCCGSGALSPALRSLPLRNLLRLTHTCVEVRGQLALTRELSSGSLGGKHPYLLNCLTSPWHHFVNKRGILPYSQVVALSGI